MKNAMCIMHKKMSKLLMKLLYISELSLLYGKIWVCNTPKIGLVVLTPVRTIQYNVACVNLEPKWFGRKHEYESDSERRE